MNQPWWKSRAVNVLFWLIPPAFLIWLFHDGLNCWFLQDDFAWLGLVRQVHSSRDLLRVLFEPAAQGTIRPWSERGFFLLFETLFGLDDLPFRIMAFATMTANLLLLTWIVRRLTHSRLAGLIAALTWAANAALTTVMAWSSAYNEAMCACFLLSAMALLIRWAETGKISYWWAQMAVFVVGLGALEIDIVYPALAAAYAIFIAGPEERKRLLRGCVPLFAISIVYFAIHQYAAPVPRTGPYLVRLDGRIFHTLLIYGKWSLLPQDWQAFGHSRTLGKLIVWTGLVSIAALAVLEWRKRRTALLFFACWYLAALAPVLFLPEHLTDYYITIPTLGLAMLFGYGATCGVRKYGPVRWLALAPIVLYLAGMIPISRSATHWWLTKSEPVRALVLGVEAAHQTHPSKAILLDGIPLSVYSDSIAQGAFYPLGISHVYLTPGSLFKSGPDVVDPDKTVLDAATARHALVNEEVVVYSLSGDHLRNVTKEYERSAFSLLADRFPLRLDAGNPIYSWLLGPTWLQPDSGVRWMPGKATARLGGPKKKGTKLELSGFIPEEQLKSGPRHLIAFVDGIRVGETEINDPGDDFDRLFPMPDSSVGKEAVEIEIQVSPVDRRGGQEYGAVFGKIAIRP